MLGSLTGDIVGSIYEWDNIKTTDFPLFQDRCHFTDDSVLTVALAESILTGEELPRCRVRRQFSALGARVTMEFHEKFVRSRPC